MDILGGAAELPEVGRGQTQETAPDQGQDPVRNSLRKRKPVQNITHVARDMVVLMKMPNKARRRPQNPFQAPYPPRWKANVKGAAIVDAGDNKGMDKCGNGLRGERA